MPASHHTRGFGLIETIVGIAVMLSVFLSLFGLLRVSINVSMLGKAKATASAVAQSQMEYLRGLSYDALGTAGGIPSGPVPQISTTTINGIEYETRTFIQYVDDPADGTGIDDDTGITTDYKVAKATVSYTIQGVSKSSAFVSKFAPPSIESSTGGGTLMVKAVSAVGDPISNATVRIVNQSIAPTIDLTTYTNTTGLVYLPGAATSSAYEIYVSKSGYSSAQTYAQDAQNVSPSPGVLTVAQDQTTTSTFAIDLLATLTLSTFSPVETTTFADTFTDGATITASTSVIVANGALTLNPGASSGDARSIVFTPQYLAHWVSASSTLNIPDDTAVRVQIFDGSGTLIPDGVLLGNASGFATFPIDLSGVSTSTYPSLALGALLSTATTTSPQVLDWSLEALAGPMPLPNISFTLTGGKTIGSTGGGAPIYKTIMSDATDGAGQKALSLEYDGYTLSVASYDIIDACPMPPYALAPSANLFASLILGAPSADNLIVSVIDSTGQVVAGVTVDLTRTGFSASASSSSCGNAYFGDLSANTYTVTITKTGYTTTQFTSVAVDGVTTYSAAFP